MRSSRFAYQGHCTAGSCYAYRHTYVHICACIHAGTCMHVHMCTYVPSLHSIMYHRHASCCMMQWLAYADISTQPSPRWPCMAHADVAQCMAHAECRIARMHACPSALLHFINLDLVTTPFARLHRLHKHSNSNFCVLLCFAFHRKWPVLIRQPQRP